MPVVLVLDQVRSFYNVGSFFRTADGAGLERLVLCGITAHPPQEGIKKTALGAEETVEWEYEMDATVALRRMKAKGYQVVAVETGEGAEDLFEWAPRWPVCLVFGNEVEGVNEAVLAECEGRVALEMRGVKNSLNVATVGGIVSYELLRKWRGRLK